MLLLLLLPWRQRGRYRMQLFSGYARAGGCRKTKRCTGRFVLAITSSEFVTFDEGGGYAILTVRSFVCLCG